MSDNNCFSQHIYPLLAQALRLDRVRGPLAAIALFCIAAATATPALSQGGCGASPVVTANRWTMVGIPCEPPTNEATVLGVFGSSLGMTSYAVTWIAWKRVYDDARCAVPPGQPADCYIKLSANSPVALGDAFWIYTTQQATLAFPSTAAENTNTATEFPIILATSSDSRYYMFANPYKNKVSWANLQFVFANNTSVNTAAAVTSSIVSKNVHYWNGNTYFTRDLNPPAATFDPKEAAWLEMKMPSVAPVKLRVPKP